LYALVIPMMAFSRGGAEAALNYIRGWAGSLA